MFPVRNAAPNPSSRRLESGRVARPLVSPFRRLPYQSTVGDTLANDEVLMKDVMKSIISRLSFTEDPDKKAARQADLRATAGRVRLIGGR